MTSELDAHAATEALARDEIFGSAVERFGAVDLGDRDGRSAFAALVRSIVFQQLAGSAAAAIHGRVVEVLGGAVTPATVRDVDDDELRGAGLSGAKVAAIRDLSTKVADGTVDLTALDEAPDDEVREQLIQVRGIGPWTADMFLIFHLQRPDVWPTGDLGVRAGYARLADLDEPPTARELEPLGEPYRPWRTAAAWYCWRAMDGPY